MILSVSLAVVFDDLTGLAGLGGGDVDDLLAGSGPSDRPSVEAEVCDASPRRPACSSPP